MRQIIVSIPDNFYNAFIEFFKHIPNAKIQTNENIAIPEWHQQETLNRIKSANSNDFISWKKGKKLLKYKTVK